MSTRALIASYGRGPTVCAALLLSILSTRGAAQILERPEPEDPIPDPCTLRVGNVANEGWHGLEDGARVHLYAGRDEADLALGSRQHLVVLVSGNGYEDVYYRTLAELLAWHGFSVAIVDRTDAWGDPDVVLAALEIAFDELGLRNGTPIGLMGHSRGATSVFDAVIANRTLDLGYDVRAVMSVSPRVDGAGHLTAEDVPAHLVLYGSQDMDTTGTAGVPREGFAAYDASGTESSTTCTEPVCLVGTGKGMDRTHIYVHGADHEGLFGHADLWNRPETQLNEFIHPDDQHCLTQAYTLGFMDWKVRGNPTYESTLR